jgi:hypothetical protein
LSVVEEKTPNSPPLEKVVSALPSVKTNNLSSAVEKSMSDDMEKVIEVPVEVKESPKPALARVTFLRDIRPILENKCVSCHGAERQKGGLRLDTHALALKGGDSGPAMVPG